MWQLWQVEKAIDFIKKYDMTALIFHQNDIIDKLVRPSKYFSEEICLARWPFRYAIPMHNLYYINEITRRCKVEGIQFFVEVKELYYPHEIIELYPELRSSNGAICPTHPFWWEFLEEKIREFLELVPDVSGIIVSPGTRESMISIAANGCNCERCRGYDINLWYKQLLTAMYKPMAEKEKTLVIRDFAYTADHQNAMLDTAAELSDKIIIALKNTPHDYYPTFPDNPRVGKCGNLRQWIEFDTWGQYFGLGFLPCSVIEDMKYRLQHCFDLGADGAWFRTDWEIITEGSVFNSYNLLNLIGGAMLSKATETELDDVYKAWLDYGLLSPMRSGSFYQKPVRPTGKDAFERLKEFMKLGWRIHEKTGYVRGHVFQENVQWPDSVDKAFNMMVRFHRRDDWDPGAHLLVEPTDENIKIIFREKDEALELVKQLPEVLQIDQLGLPEEAEKDLRIVVDLFELYVRVFRLCAHACFLTRKAETTKNKADIEAARKTILPITEIREEVYRKVENKGYPHYVNYCMDYKRLDSLVSDVERILGSL
jgi:hypothetical protein